MTVSTSTSIQETLLRHGAAIQADLRRVVKQAHELSPQLASADLAPYYGEMKYHLGWVDTDLHSAANKPGKLLRPTLLLLAFEAAGAWGLAAQNGSSTDYLHRALPAAVAIELTHNFTLIHDDIEDGDNERHHRPTLWKLCGVPQAINAGDGMFALARLALWDVLDRGVEGALAARLGAVLDRASLVLSEGQYLDISFEAHCTISVAMYMDMICRKTAALMACAAEMGAMLGTSDQETIDRLRDFGRAIGIAFQVRDDLLGVWATTAQLGKTPAGDIYRRKKSLPILHALEQSQPDDRQVLHTIYRQEAPVTDEQVAAVLAIFARTQTRANGTAFLAQQCRLAHEALANVPSNSSPIAARALEDMDALIRFVETAIP